MLLGDNGGRGVVRGRSGGSTLLVDRESAAWTERTWRALR